MKATNRSVVLLLAIVPLLTIAEPVYRIVRIGDELSGAPFSQARDLNNNSTVVVDWNGHAFLWDSVNGMQDLGEFYPIRINDQNVVAGSAQSQSGGIHAAIWDSTNVMQYLGELPGFIDESRPLAINASGQVVGYSWGQT